MKCIKSFYKNLIGKIYFARFQQLCCINEHILYKTYVKNKTLYCMSETNDNCMMERIYNHNIEK